jgi:aerobic carbon-monoxide dehydrogenase small subunit
MKKEIKVTINGDVVEGVVENRTLLVDFIRETAELTGTHVGCSAEGRCGACTILLDGVAVKSCLMLAVQADGAGLVTVEGLALDGKLHPIQEAFWEHHGLQCGYCTPGMLMALCEFLRNPSREEADIRTAMSGVLCPCTGYVHIIDSVRAAIDKLEAMDDGERVQAFASLGGM